VQYVGPKNLPPGAPRYVLSANNRFAIDHGILRSVGDVTRTAAEHCAATIGASKKLADKIFH
jgi:hypothetical protein